MGNDIEPAAHHHSRRRQGEENEDHGDKGGDVTAEEKNVVQPADQYEEGKDTMELPPYMVSQWQELPEPGGAAEGREQQPADNSRNHSGMGGGNHGEECFLRRDAVFKQLGQQQQEGVAAEKQHEKCADNHVVSGERPATQMQWQETVTGEPVELSRDQAPCGDGDQRENLKVGVAPTENTFDEHEQYRKTGEDGSGTQEKIAGGEFGGSLRHCLSPRDDDRDGLLRVYGDSVHRAVHATEVAELTLFRPADFCLAVVTDAQYVRRAA